MIHSKLFSIPIIQFCIAGDGWVLSFWSSQLCLASAVFFCTLTIAPSCSNSTQPYSPKGKSATFPFSFCFCSFFFPIATRTWAKLAGVVSGTRSGAVRNRDEGPNSRSACGPDAYTPCSTKAARRLWRVRNCHWVVPKRKFSYDPRGSLSIPLFMARTRSADSCRIGPPTVIGGGPICKSSQNRAEDVITGISGHLSGSRSTLCAYRFSGHETGRLQSHISRHFDMIPYDDACFLLFFLLRSS